MPLFWTLYSANQTLATQEFDAYTATTFAVKRNSVVCLQVKNHVELMEALDLIDFEAAADVTGSKFYYLRNAAAMLELALINYTMQVGNFVFCIRATVSVSHTNRHLMGYVRICCLSRTVQWTTR